MRKQKVFFFSAWNGITVAADHLRHRTEQTYKYVLFLYEQISWITCLEEIDMIFLFKQILLLHNSAATPFNDHTLKIINSWIHFDNTILLLMFLDLHEMKKMKIVTMKKTIHSIDLCAVIMKIQLISIP